MPQSGGDYIDLHFCFGGVDLSNAFDRQPNRPGSDGQYARTTPVAINVRAFEPATDRMRGGSRPGLSRYCPDQINGTHSIQDVTSIILPKSSFAAMGQTFVIGSASFTVRLLDSSGVLALTVAIASTGYGCLDAARNAYYACLTGSNVQFTKINTTVPVQAYQVTLGLTGITNVYAAQAFDDVVYLLVTVSGGSRIYRVNPDDGALLDTGPWVSMTTPFNAVSMSVTTDRIGVLGFVSGDGTYLRQYDLDTGGLVLTTTIQTDGGAVPEAICSDGAGHFFAASQGATLDQIVKVDAAGALLWTVSGTGVAVSGLAYDAVTPRLAVVGATLLGTTDSFQSRNVTTGAKIAGGQPGTETSWSWVAADGSGSFRLAKTSKVIKLASDLTTVTWTNTADVAPANWVVSSNSLDSDSTDTMRSTRQQINLAVSAGLLARFNSDGKTTIDVSFLSPLTSVVYGQPRDLWVYYVDGTQYKKYDASTGVTSTWTASAGSLPSDSASGEKCRLICLWRGRLLLSGLRSDPQNIFASAVTDGAGTTSFDYSPTSQSPTQAWAANTGTPFGLMGDTVNSMVPYSDDICYVLMDHSISMISGDPMDGGRIDIVSTTIGGAFGRPWCKSPDGTLYFFGSRGGIYAIVPGQVPVRVTQAINNPLNAVNLAENTVTMAWDESVQGMNLFITPRDGSATTHWFLDNRSTGWFEVQFANDDHNPMCCYTLDGDAPNDRVLVIGSFDGYIRWFDPAATKDDGTAIAWQVLIGPILTPNLDEVMLHDLQPILSEISGDATYGVLVGRTAEAASTSTAVRTGPWKAGRGLNTPIRRAGHAIYVKLSGVARFAMEAIRLRAENLGPIRMRGR